MQADDEYHGHATMLEANQCEGCDIDGKTLLCREPFDADGFLCGLKEGHSGDCDHTIAPPLYVVKDKQGEGYGAYTTREEAQSWADLDEGMTIVEWQAPLLRAQLREHGLTTTNCDDADRLPDTGER